MTTMLSYFLYVVRHKWFVFLECLKIGVPLWGAIIHDWQKFTPTEWRPYALSFYGPWKYKERPGWLVEALDRAWLHHQHHGPHHWQYWILRENNGSIKSLKMPDRYKKEMLADLRGTGRAKTGKDDTLDWYLRNRDEIQLHPETREWIERQLGVMEKSFPSLYIKGD